MIRNESGECLVEHHVKYKELHGEDETVWMTHGEHKALHNKLRRNDICVIPVKDLRKITNGDNKI